MNNIDTDNIIDDLELELVKKKRHKEDFIHSMKQELIRISNKNDHDKQSNIWNNKLKELTSEIDNLHVKIKKLRSTLQESIIMSINESVFEDKLKDFIEHNWKNTIEKSFIKELKKYKDKLYDNSDDASKYLQNLQSKNKRLLQTNCSEEFLGELNKLTKDYSPNISSFNSNDLDLNNEFDNFNDDKKDNVEDDMSGDEMSTFNAQNNDDNEKGEMNNADSSNSDESGSEEVKNNNNSNNNNNKSSNNNSSGMKKESVIFEKERSFETEFIRVEIKSKRRGKIPSILLQRIIEILKSDLFLDKRNYVIQNNSVVVKKVPLQDYNTLKHKMSELDSSIEVKLIGLYSDKRYVNFMGENKASAIDRLLKTDSKNILLEFDSFFSEYDNIDILHEWKKNKKNININEEINSAVNIIKLNNLEKSLDKFLILKETVNNNVIFENYLYSPTKEYCYEVTADITFNPFNTNKDPKLYFCDESTAKNFVKSQKAGNCKYNGKVA